MNVVEPSRLRRLMPKTQIRMIAEEGDRYNVRGSDFWKLVAYGCVIGAFLLLLIGFFYLAKSFLVPIVAAAVVSATFGPLAVRAERYHIPAVLFAFLGVLLVLAVINTILLLLGGTISGWAERAPEIADAIRNKAQILDRPLAALKEFETALASMLGSPPLKADFSASSLIGPTLAFLTPALGEFVLFVAALFFFLVGRSRQRKFVVMLFATQEGRLRALRILNDIEENFGRYLLTVTAVNALVGVAAGMIAFFAGLENSPILGTVAFLLNYVPYIGPATTAVVLFVVGITTLPGFTAALIAPACFVLVATIEGQFLIPSVLGRQLTVSPLAIFLSLAFWTWLWGPIGTFLAMPFLIAAVMIRTHLFPAETVTLPE